MKYKFRGLLPLLIFLALASVFVRRIVLIDHGDMPNDLPSVMIGKPIPAFDLPALFDGHKNVASKDFKGHVTLVNFFASWCVDCQIEHPSLTLLKGHGAVLTGIDYKDTKAGATAWLKKHGNPYDILAADKDGRAALNFGLYGVPETYIVDKKGIIRYKQTGPMTPDVIKKTILPIIERLEK